jgi:uncharacterized protein DUF5947
MNRSSGLRRFVNPASDQLASTASAEPATAPATGSVTGPSAGPSAEPAEKCELCATEIPAGHGHVADLEHSRLMCACRACYLLFTHAQAGRGKYRAIPDRYLIDQAHPLTISEWDTLEVPVGLAFFLATQGTVTAFYPSPAGATECQLDLAAWNELVTDHPLLGELAADVEAVLMWRSAAQVETFLVPIDACYELAGRMRLHWRGFDGGEQAQASIAEFLDRVRTQARDFVPAAARG